MAPRPPRTPEVCPVCGETVPARALACPECGADGRSGWHEGADHDATPDSEFDYEQFVAEEFGKPAKPPGIALLWWVTAVILLLAFAWYALRAL